MAVITTAALAGGALAAAGGASAAGIGAMALAGAGIGGILSATTNLGDMFKGPETPKPPKPEAPVEKGRCNQALCT